MDSELSEEFVTKLGCIKLQCCRHFAVLVDFFTESAREGILIEDLMNI